MKTGISRMAASAVMAMWFAVPGLALAYSPMPDLTAAGAIAALKIDSNSSPVYSESYNLGPTGLRGWIYIDRNNTGQEGLITAQSRQILVKVASAPGNAVLAVDDVILGAMAASSGTVPLFASDCRKAFGVVIGEAEKTGAGTLRVKRWRAGTTTDVSIPITIMGEYSATAPYNCPKSALILTNAITKLNQETLSGDWTGAASGLALLAAVKPGDANYTAVQAKVQTFARSLAPASLHLTGCDTWGWGYIGTFLGEYFLRTVADGSPDTTVLHGINEYTVGLAKGQSKYGTFGHGGAEQQADGSLHGSISWYGPVNSAGLIANLAIVIGKKALVAGGITPDPEIDPAIERGAKFFAYFVNKGGIPYGEHEPWSGGHASNGKDAMAAVFFGLQDNRPVETEYFTRMSTAGWVGREYGHTGQGFSYFWAALGAAMGGDAAAAAHLNQVRWHLDLERRTDGSFVYDGGEQYGGSSTSTYLGSSSYSGLSPNACYVLTYALPLKRLHITGRNANPANTLDAAKVANAIAAATYERDCTGYPVATLMTALSEYDPVLRHDAAAELGKSSRVLTTTEVNTLIALITNGTLSPDANVRQGACETLGIRKTTGALTALSQRLSDTDQWVRGKASNALRNFGSAASGQITPMLTAFAANATDPNVIVWDDPIQIANGYLADTLFQALASNTNALSGSARTNLLYPALRAGLKQPDGMARMYLGDFIQNRLTLADVQAVAPSIVDAAAERSPADRMFSDVIRYAALSTLGKYKIEEGIPLCLEVKEQTWHGDDWLPFELLTTTYRGAAKDALPTLYKWQAYVPQFAADGSIGGCCPERLNSITTKIASTIAAIENDAAPPTLTYFKSMTASASPPVVTLPTTSTVLTPVLSDLDAGTPNFVWSKVSGAGAVSFNPPGLSANATCTATFDTPGTYVLRVTAVDRSILDYNTWITYSLGYADFMTYNEILGALSKNVTVTVSPDPNRAPVPQNQSLTTPLNTDVSITLAATDPNGDPMTYAVVTPPAHGTLAGTAPDLLYTPATAYTGPDGFTFKANDGKVDSAAATIAIEVGATGNRRPTAQNQFVTSVEDTAKGLILTGTDPDSDPLIYEIVHWPAHGTLTGTPPNLTYQPTANYPAGNANGSDSFTFTVRDAALTSAVATVSITVTPVNDAPQALAQSVSVSANSTNLMTLTGLDPEGYALSYTVATNPGHGTLTGTAPNLTYQPTTNYRGLDSFTFRVTDSEGVVSSAATVSITIINDPPVANPQFVELQPNTSTAVTLTGSDSANDPLTYTVLTQPAHGDLTGTAPNLTYTPAPGYTGADSFTFKANDGVNDSPAATVTLNIVQWLTWTNLASGTWSTGTKWSGGGAPAAGGSSTGLLVFNTSTYSGTSSNDLAGTFQLNRLNLGSVLPALTISGNALSFTMNSATLPQVNLNSANAVTLSNNLTITAGIGIGGTGAGTLTLSGIISGAGSLTKTTSGGLTLSGVNTFSGGTTVSSGTLTLANRNGLGTGPATLAAGTTFQQANFEGNDVTGALPNAFVLSGSGNVIMNIPFGGGKDIWLSQAVTGTGGMTVQGGGRSLTLTAANSFGGGIILRNYDNRVQISNASALGTGTFRSERTTANSGQLISNANLASSSGVTNAFDIAAGAYLNILADGSNHLLLSGPISSAGGPGNLYKSGTATLTLSGANTYTGKTTVSAGILACSSATSLGGGALDLASGATLQLNFPGTRRVSSLTLGGTVQTNLGTYGSSSSGATYQSSFFSGTGTVTVGPAFAFTSTALVLTGGSTPTGLGTPLTFTATVTGSTPAGNVTFHADATLMGTSALNGLSQASFTTNSLALGSYAITARYAGDPANDPSTSAVLPIRIVVPPAPPTNLVATPGSNTVGLTWNASSGASGYNVKRATVTGGPYTTLGTASGTSYSDGTASNGTTYYYVVAATNGAGESTNSGQASATPMPASPSTTTLASSLGATGAYGAAVTFTATVTVTGGPATGTVTFKDGATVLGTATLSSGQASHATSTFTVGSHSITATYNGNPAFVASTSSAFGYTTSPKAVTITGVTASNKPYDGSTTATLTAGSVIGVISGDTVTVVAGTGTFASAAEGTWAVTATGYALGGTHAGSYVLSAQPTVPAATITSVTGIIFATTTLNTATTATGAEILNTGTLIAANHVGNGGQTTITLANGLTFGTSITHLINPNGGNQEILPVESRTTGWGHNAGDSGIATITNPAFSNLINSRWWVAYTDSRSDMAITGLVIGNTYRLQLISVAPNSGTVAVEGSPEYTWSGNNTMLTVTWVAADTTLNMQYSRKQQASPGGQGGEVSFNGYALHNISPASTLKDITSFTFPTYGAATIAGSSITLAVPTGTPVSAMAPTYTVSPNATGAPVSGTSRNFTTPQTYTITAQDLSTKIFTVTVVPLVQPANLVATPGNNSVGLTWNASSGASGYKVKRATISGGPYTTLGTPGVTSYSDTAATNGTTYYYVVSATSGALESANSSQVSAIPSALSSTTTLASSLGGTGAYGAVTFTATVTAGASGTVTFRDGTTVLGSGTLAAGRATYVTSTLAMGGHSITATYEGDPIYAPSTSAAFSYAVSAKTVTITGVTAGDKVYDGNPTAVLSGGTVFGVINGDTVTVVAGSGSFASARVGTWAVTATGCSLGGTHAGNYVLATQPTVANATITARPLQLAGTRTYDGTTTATADVVSITNNLDGASLSLTGSTNLAGKEVGAQAILPGYATPVRVRYASGSSGTSSTSFTVTMSAAPASGNTLIAVISTRGSTADRVSGISSVGATWARVAQSTNTSGSTTEIWSAPIGSGAGATVTIAIAAGRCAAVVVEYSGILPASPVDQTAASPGGNSTSPLTGTTSATTQANEVWIGAIGYRSSTPTLGTILNSFTSVASAQSTSITAGNNAKVYALESIVTATGSAGSGGTLSPAAIWSGAIATFKAASVSTLALTGPAAGNYTLAGATGEVLVTAKALTLTGTTVTNKTYDGLSAATLTGGTLRVAEAAGTGSPLDGVPYSGDALVLALSGTFDTIDAGTGKAVTSAATLSGAQAGNYSLTQPAGLTGTITPAALSVTADNQSKTYGQTLTFGSGGSQFTSSELQNGEMIGSVTLACDGGGAAAVVASYPITPDAATGGTFAAGNYTISYLPGTLTVNPADQTITFETLAAMTCGEAPFDLTATASSGLPVSYVSSDPTVASVAGNTVTLLKAGSITITASQPGDGNYTAATPVGQSLTVHPANPGAFATWASDPAQGLTAGVNNGPLDDPDHDGISNLLEFALGGEPMVSSQAIQPKLTHAASGWVFEYERSDLSLAPATIQVVEYGSDLTGWSAVTIPEATYDNVSITPGTFSDHVKVIIPNSVTKRFVRLKVTQ
ncbi:MAG: DUF6288 domain-containing protein [Verrucomicrobia bacterium]|nr:DUF6288 domain-containing protein [Verrucomicrobiota bacterium]